MTEHTYQADRRQRGFGHRDHGIFLHGRLESRIGEIAPDLDRIWIASVVRCVEEREDRMDIAECTREEELCLAAVDQPVVSRQEEEVVVCDAAGASALRMTGEVRDLVSARGVGKPRVAHRSAAARRASA